MKTFTYVLIGTAVVLGSMFATGTIDVRNTTWGSTFFKEAAPCSDERVTKTVLNFLKDQYLESSSKFAGTDAIPGFDLSNQLPVSYDKNIKRRACQAVLTLHLDDKSVQQINTLLDVLVKAPQTNAMMSNLAGGTSVLGFRVEVPTVKTVVGPQIWDAMTTWSIINGTSHVKNDVSYTLVYFTQVGENDNETVSTQTEVGTDLVDLSAAAKDFSVRFPKNQSPPVSQDTKQVSASDTP